MQEIGQQNDGDGVAFRVTSGKVASNGVELFYEARGPEDGEPVVFIMGLGAQMVFWPEPLLDDLVARGYRVIRFDNRDVGLSTRVRAKLRYKPLTALGRAMIGLSVEAPYTLHDMVDDTCGLLDALGIEAAHLVGASMGGMIGQLMAAHRPQRVRSLTSIMSATNSRFTPPPKPSALMALIGPRPVLNSVDEYIEHGLGLWQRLAGSLPQGQALLAQMLAQSWERGLYPRGVMQQFLAVMATGSFGRQLRAIKAPVTVIHGSQDPLIRPAGGRSSARAIPGAKLEIIRGMGHDLPEMVLPQIADLIHGNIIHGNIGRLADAG